ncbi:MAG: hypothetical protein KJN90_08420 [Gammaproteobacteria bacterium]|nr:hypothetical protein [Gammaproteobacteria bacterium]
MAKEKSRKQLSQETTKPATHPVEKLENQFQLLQRELANSRKNYLASYKDEVLAARERMQQIQTKLRKARKQVARAAVDARTTGTRSTKNQLKKTRAASLLLTDSLQEARKIMASAQRKLHAAKPFDRKLAARAKVLAKFEKDWDRKMREEAATKAAQAKKAAAKRRSTARKRAAKKLAGKKPSGN